MQVRFNRSLQSLLWHHLFYLREKVLAACFGKRNSFHSVLQQVCRISRIWWYLLRIWSASCRTYVLRWDYGMITQYRVPTKLESSTKRLSCSSPSPQLLLPEEEGLVRNRNPDGIIQDHYKLSITSKSKVLSGRKCPEPSNNQGFEIAMNLMCSSKVPSFRLLEALFWRLQR